MDCGYFEKLIYRLPDGDLSETEMAALTEHIDACDACRTLYDAVTAAHEAIAELESVPEDFGARVMDAVRAEEKARKTKEEQVRRNARIRQRWRFGDLGLVAACLALVVVTLNVLFGDLGQRSTADTAEAAPMMLEAAAEEAAPETAEAAYGVAEATAMDGATDTGAADTASMAREAAEDAAPSTPEGAVYAADGSYLGALAPDAVDALLTNSGSAAETDAACDWTMQLSGTAYELFSVDDAIYWRKSGHDGLTRSAMSADDFIAAIE